MPQAAVTDATAGHPPLVATLAGSTPYIAASSSISDAWNAS